MKILKCVIEFFKELKHHLEKLKLEAEDSKSQKQQRRKRFRDYVEETVFLYSSLSLRKTSLKTISLNLLSGNIQRVRESTAHKNIYCHERLRSSWWNPYAMRSLPFTQSPFWVVKRILVTEIRMNLGVDSLLTRIYEVPITAFSLSFLFFQIFLSSTFATQQLISPPHVFDHRISHFSFHSSQNIINPEKPAI